MRLEILILSFDDLILIFFFKRKLTLEIGNQQKCQLNNVCCSSSVPRRKDTLGDLFGRGGGGGSGGSVGVGGSSVSAAIDVRLELRVDLMADVRTRTIAQKDAHTLHNAIHANIPVTAIHMMQIKWHGGPKTGGIFFDFHFNPVPPSCEKCPY